MVKLTRPSDFKDERHLPSKAILSQIGHIAVVAASIEDILHDIHWKFAGLSKSAGPVVTDSLGPDGRHNKAW